jgi:hypothetical protein
VPEKDKGFGYRNQRAINIVAYAIVSAVTVYLFTSSAWFQNKLLGLKSRYEDASR